jgi:hypothetical protein
VDGAVILVQDGNAAEMFDCPVIDLVLSYEVPDIVHFCTRGSERHFGGLVGDYFIGEDKYAFTKVAYRASARRGGDGLQPDFGVATLTQTAFFSPRKPEGMTQDGGKVWTSGNEPNTPRLGEFWSGTLRLRKEGTLSFRRLTRGQAVAVPD